MRPRKRVLLIDVDADRLACTRFVLRVKGYAVISTSNATAAERLARSEARVDGVVAWSPVWEQRAAYVADRAGTDLVLVRDLAGADRGFARIPLVRPTMAELLERVRVACMRKRGPRKGWKKPVRGAEGERVLARRTA